SVSPCAAWSGSRRSSPACCATSWRTRSSARAPAATVPPGCRRASRSGSRAATRGARTRPPRPPHARASPSPPATPNAPFQTLPPDAPPLGYAESLSAVAYILRARGEAGVVRLLAALADQLPSEEAIPVALALSYPELQHSWELELAGSAGKGSR